MSRLWYKLPAELTARKDLTPTAKIAYAVLAHRMGSNGYCWPGLRRLAEDCGTHIQTLARALESLVRLGLLALEHRGHGRTNRYRLVDKGCNPPPTAAQNCTQNPHTLSNNFRPNCAQNTHTSARILRPRCVQNTHTGTRKIHTEVYAKCTHNIKDKVKREIKGPSAEAPVRQASAEAREPPTSPSGPAGEFVAWFGQAYGQAVGEDYGPGSAKEVQLVERLLDQLGPEQLRQSAQAMLSDPRQQHRACIGLLSLINSSLGQAIANPETPANPLSFAQGPALTTDAPPSAAKPAATEGNGVWKPYGQSP